MRILKSFSGSRALLPSANLRGPAPLVNTEPTGQLGGGGTNAIAAGGGSASAAQQPTAEPQGPAPLAVNGNTAQMTNPSVSAAPAIPEKTTVPSTIISSQSSLIISGNALPNNAGTNGGVSGYVG